MPVAPLPKVGIVSSTEYSARSLAHELNIANYIPFGVNSHGYRGQRFATLLVEDTVWPLSPTLLQDLEPALEHHRAYILCVHRHDPWKK